MQAFDVSAFGRRCLDEEIVSASETVQRDDLSKLKHTSFFELHNNGGSPSGLMLMAAKLSEQTRAETIASPPSAPPFTEKKSRYSIE